MRSAFVYGFVAVLVALIALSFFTFPSADDFSYATMALSRGFWQAQHDWYVEWSGRYSSSAVLSLSPLFYGWYFGYTVAAIATTALFVGSAYIFISTVLGNVLDQKTKLVFFCAFMLVYLAELPSPVEGIYWYAGAVNYTWPWAILLFGATWYLKNRGWQLGNGFVKNQSTLSVAFMSLGLGVMSLLLAGFNETIILLEIYFIFAATIFYFISHRKIDFALLLPLLACLIGLLIVIKAPGNDIRASRFPESRNLIRALVKSLGLGIEVFFRYLKPAFMLALLMVIPVATNLKTKISEKFYSTANRRLFILGFIGTMLLFLLPAQWAMDGAPPKRAMNILCFLHLTFVSIIIFQLVLAYEDRAIRFYNFLNQKISPRVWATLFVVSLLVKSNLVIVFTDLATKAFPYSHQQTARLEIIKQNSGKDLVLKKISTQPESLMFDDVQEDPTDWRNTAFSSYYDLRSVRLEKGNQ